MGAGAIPRLFLSAGYVLPACCALSSEWGHINVQEVCLDVAAALAKCGSVRGLAP